jgi:hypothetical protein
MLVHAARGHTALRDLRGAVMVEKLIAFLPLLSAFFATWELAELTAAHLVVQRASSAAGRAAVVVLPDDPLFYDGEDTHSYAGRRRDDIELAAGMVLSAMPRLKSTFDVSVSDPPEDVGPIDVTVQAQYDCGLVSFFCSGDGELSLTATTRHTYHGAKYAYSTVGGLGGSSQALSANFRAGYRSNKSTQLGHTTQAVKNGGSSSNGGGTKGAGNSSQATCKYVYRFDKRSPDEIFKNGFSPWGSNLDLAQHVEGSNMKDSGYVSTTSSMQAAYKLYWVANHNKNPPQGYIYKIRECCGVDVNKTVDPSCLDAAGQQRVKDYAWQQEIAVPGKIDGQSVVSATQPRPKDRPKGEPPIKSNMTPEEIQAYKDWPPLDSIRTKPGKTQTNSSFRPEDADPKGKGGGSCIVM